MAWATQHIEKLKQGETVTFRPFGNSMQGRIESGQLVTVSPVNVNELSKNDIVLCRVGAFQYLHLIKAIRKGQFLIGNNKGRDNGWVDPGDIFGKCIKVEA